MAQQKGNKQGKHKPYGPKMARPRISQSKEHRGRGPFALKCALDEATKGNEPWYSRAYFLAHQQALVETRKAKAEARRAWHIQVNRMIDIEAHFTNLDTVSA